MAVHNPIWKAPLLTAIVLTCVVGCGEITTSGTAPIDGPCVGGCDDYVAAVAPEQVRVLSYNVFLRPPPVNALDAPGCRARRIGQWLNQVDVDIVALQETFEPSSTSALVDGAATTLPFQVVSQPPPLTPVGTSGGLSILSRFPIEEARTLTYDACRGALSDCVAAKGAVHAVVRLSEQSRVNVVATHLDAGRSDQNRAVRAAQVDQLRDFLTEVG